MKPQIIIVCFMGIFSFLFGCKQQELSKENLYGNWEAVKLNGGPINKHGFTSIIMSISPDSIHITTVMETFGEVTTKSEGTWKLIGNVFKSKIGETEKSSNIEVRGSNIAFTPDPLFKQEAVFKSEYKKVL